MAVHDMETLLKNMQSGLDTQAARKQVDYSGEIAALQARALPGLVSIKPTAVSGAGGSLSVSDTDDITFTGVTAFRTDGIFTPAHRRYLVKLTALGTNDYIRARFSTGGVITTLGAYYYGLAIQQGGSTTVLQNANAQVEAIIGYCATGNNSEYDFNIANPNIVSATPTLRNDGEYSSTNHTRTWGSALFNGSGGFDGLYLAIFSGTMTGKMHVYGYSD